MSVLGTQYRLPLVCGFVFIVYMLYTIFNLPNYNGIPISLDEIDIVLENEFLVNTNKCKIKNINPYNSEVLKFFNRREYISCNDNKPLLTYIEKRGDVAVLKINQSAVPLYSYFYVYCCYQNVTRKYFKDGPDDHIRTSSRCKRFDNETIIEAPAVKVKCQNFWHRVYENAHTVVLKTEEIKEKIKRFDRTKQPLSVLFLGIDSISRINFIRMLPKTRTFLVQRNWIEMKGYNKMGDNTFPNLMAVFTGKNESYAFKTCHPYNVGGMDKCDLVWYDFRKAGYVTGYAEDETSINTFNYLKKGFNNTPSDYYFRPYFIAAEELSISWVDGMRYCTGPETSGERILNLAKEFSTTFKDDPFFGVFWTNTFSHNELTTPSVMDAKILDLFNSLEQEGVFNTTMMIFISDHGIRFGDIRNTRTGWYEERLPFIYIWLPQWFRNLYPKTIQNLQTNENRFTTPYDVFMTLQDALAHSVQNYTIRPSSACSTCASLFEEAMEDRNCEESGIDLHWCTCENYEYINPQDTLVMQSVDFIISEIHNMLRSKNISQKCHEHTLEKVISSNISKRQTNFFVLDYNLVIMFKTKHGATFEATVNVKEGETERELKFKLLGKISRLDWYANSSNCVDDLKMYCYCKSIFG